MAKITKPNQTQIFKAIGILISTHRDPEFKAIFVTEKQRKDKEFWNKNKQQWWIRPCFLVDNRYLCAFDVYYGHDIVVDLEKSKSYYNYQGIFEQEFVFLSDYYGYPEGKFFYAVN